MKHAHAPVNSHNRLTHSNKLHIQTLDPLQPLDSHPHPNPHQNQLVPVHQPTCFDGGLSPEKRGAEGRCGRHKSGGRPRACSPGRGIGRRAGAPPGGCSHSTHITHSSAAQHTQHMHNARGAAPHAPDAHGPTHVGAGRQGRVFRPHTTQSSCRRNELVLNLRFSSMLLHSLSSIVVVARAGPEPILLFFLPLPILALVRVHELPPAAPTNEQKIGNGRSMQ